jgi:hypothetical protein
MCWQLDRRAALNADGYRAVAQSGHHMMPAWLAEPRAPEPVTKAAGKAACHTVWGGRRSASAAANICLTCNHWAKWQVPRKGPHSPASFCAAATVGENMHRSKANCLLLPLSSEAHDGVDSQQLFSLQNLSLIPPEGRWFFSGPPGKPG